MNAIVVMTTVGSAEAGEKLASALVEEKLAACVQILPPMLSVYRWKGEIQKETEHLLLIKTTDEKWKGLSEFIHANHPYEVPELIAVEAAKIAPEYQKWLGGQVQG
ncbi:MAG TPA: divalent-cation tolerance protein CutA [Pyrinomonadaceae bacterium]|mgnify:CR=1 FL=1|nr:divalent-cation tolerance protein CutA [Pyrinomonadaceae bacterium]